MVKAKITALLVLAATGLAACGDTVGKQTLYGAAGGAAIAEVTGGDWRLGALMGSAANVLACDISSEPCQ